MRNNVFRVVLSVVGIVVIIALLGGCSQPAAQQVPPPKAEEKKAEAPQSAAPQADAPKPAAPNADTKAAASKPAGTEIKIGLIQSLTGYLADFGKRHRIIAEMVEKDINDAGGINGVPIKIILEDTRTDEQESVRLMQKLISDDKVLAVVGPFESPGMAISYPQAVKLKTAAVSMSPFMPGVAESVRPYGFSFNIPDATLIPPTAKAFIKAYNPKKLALVSQIDQDYLKGLGDQLADGFKAEGITVVNIGNPIGIKENDTDFGAAVTRIKGMQVDGVIIALTGRQAGPFVAEMRRQALNVPIVGDNTLTEAGYLATGGKAVEGTICGSIYWDQNPDPLQKKISDAFYARAKTEHPDNPLLDSFASITYDDFQILAKVMREGGIKNTPDSLAADREIIAKGIAGIKDYPGIGGRVSMGPNGIAQRDIFILIVKDGKWQKVD